MASPLLDFLRDRSYACVTEDTGNETVLIIKVPQRRIDLLGQKTLIDIRHEIFEHAAGPVIRMVTSFCSEGSTSFALETFFNLADPQQSKEYEHLAGQKDLRLLFVDESLEHRATSTVADFHNGDVRAILGHARQMLDNLPAVERDFARAKAEVCSRTTLGVYSS